MKDVVINLLYFCVLAIFALFDTRLGGLNE
jgi:hypothetical protein